jgi:cation:H+ antiporter
MMAVLSRAGPMFELICQPLAASVAIFVAASVAVWLAGAGVVRYVDAIADKTRIGQAFAGMLLLGAITSLPEIAAVSSASFIGNGPLSISNLLGSLTMNLVLLAIADWTCSAKAVTSGVPGPATLLQGTLGIVALALVAGAIAIGDVPVVGVGLGSIVIFVFVVFAFWLSSRYAKHSPWRADRSLPKQRRAHLRAQAPPPQISELEQRSLASLWVVTGGLSAIILVGGVGLSKTADTIASATGVSSSFLGLVLVGFATALPNFSSMVGAVRLERYEMAIGDVFGANLFELGLILLADAIYAGGPILNKGGRFALVAALAGIVLSATYLMGLLERDDRTIFGMGYDSFAVLWIYAASLAILYALS